APWWRWNPGALRGKRVGDDVARSLAAVEHVGEAVQPAWCHQEGPGRETRLDGPADDLLPLGQEQAGLGLEMRPELDVAQVAVVGEARVVRVGDLGQRCHAAKCSGCATATTSPTTMIAGGRTACRPRSAARPPKVDSTVRSPGIEPSHTT